MRSRDVDPVKCPHLYAAIRRAEARYVDEGWARVIELKKAGQDGSAARLVKRLLGVQGPPMPKERKEYLDQYKSEHKEEIKERQQIQRDIRKRTIALLTTGKKKGRRS